MFQDSVTLRHTELRRRRRYKIASRTYLGYALATLEGSFAALMVAFLAAFVPEGIPWGASEAPIVSAIGVGAVVAARALGPARTLLTLSTKRLFLPEAATPFLSGIGLVWLLQLIAGAPFVAPDLQVWKWLVLAAVFVCLARGLIYGRILAMFAVGQLQIERTALVGVGEDLTQFERGARIWRSGGQVMARLSLESAEVDISDQPATQFLADCARRGCDRHRPYAGELAAALERNEWRALAPAGLHGPRTARRERTALRQIFRIGNGAGNGDQPFAAAIGRFLENP